MCDAGHARVDRSSGGLRKSGLRKQMQVLILTFSSLIVGCIYVPPGCFLSRSLQRRRDSVLEVYSVAGKRVRMNLRVRSGRIAPHERIPYRFEGVYELLITSSVSKVSYMVDAVRSAKMILGSGMFMHSADSMQCASMKLRSVLLCRVIADHTLPRVRTRTSAALLGGMHGASFAKF